MKNTKINFYFKKFKTFHSKVNEPKEKFAYIRFDIRDDMESQYPFWIVNFHETECKVPADERGLYLTNNQLFSLSDGIKTILRSRIQRVGHYLAHSEWRGHIECIFNHEWSTEAHSYFTAGAGKIKLFKEIDEVKMKVPFSPEEINFFSSLLYGLQAE